MHQTSTAEPDRGRLYRGLSWLILAIGALAQLGHYLGQRPLWLDETLVALNIRDLSAAELAGKLDYGQFAATGWVYLQRASALVVHDPELGARLVAIIAGLVALVAFRDVALRLLKGPGALAALALFALPGPLANYAAETKPYALAAMLATLVLAVCAARLGKARLTLIDYAVLLAAGLLAAGLALPVVYVLAACGGALILERVLARKWGEALALGAIAAAWLLLFVSLYLFVYGPQLHGNELVDGGSHVFFERVGYAPIPPRSLSDLIWYPKWAKDLTAFFFQEEGWVAAGLLILAGAISALRTRPLLALMLLGPIAIALVASGFEAYPLFNRLCLFMLPLFAVLAGFGVDWFVARARGALAPALALTLVALVGVGTFLAANLAQRPPFLVTDTPGALAYVHDHASSRDSLYVTNIATPTFLFYRPAAGLTQMRWAFGNLPVTDWDCIARDLDGLPADAPIYILSELTPLNIPLGMEQSAAAPKLVFTHGKTWLYRIERTDGLTGALAREAAQPMRCLDGRTAKADRVLQRETTAGGRPPVRMPSGEAVDDPTR